MQSKLVTTESDLLSKVLDMGRIEAGKLDLDERPFILPKLVDDIDLLNLTRRQNPIEITKDPELYPGSVLGDTLRLNQVLSNVLGNAIKFCPEGKIQIAAHQEWETASQVGVHFCEYFRSIVTKCVL